jgi:6-phosphogluconolactonase (cycloisomerase 2 family)
MSGLPVVRSDGVLVQALGDELVIYDHLSEQAHALNAVAASVWRACDGTRSPDVIAKDLELLGEVVDAAVAQFAAAGLLEDESVPAGWVDRRRLLIGAAAVSVPVLMSTITVPAAMAADSGTLTGMLTPVSQNPTSNASTGGSPITVAFATSSSGQLLLATANNGSDTVSIFQVSDAGALTPATQNPVSSADTGRNPASAVFATSSSGQLLLATANYNADTVSVFQVSASGALTPVTQNPAGNASTGTNPGSVAFATSSSGQLLLAAANFNDNSVSMFQVSAAGALTPVTQNPAGDAASGSGPALLAFGTSSSGQLLLATADLKADSVTVFQVSSTGALTPVDQSGSNASTGLDPTSVAFATSSSGQLLLATANNGADTVSIFQVTETGALSPVTQTPASNTNTGSGPQSVTFLTSSNGQLLLAAANSGDDTVSLFQVSAAGSLTPVPQTGNDADTGGNPQSVAAATAANGQVLLATANYNADTVSMFQLD